MHDQQKVLEWIEAVCLEAANDVVLANRLSTQSPALAHYFMNVTKLHSVQAEAWHHWYPQHFAEAERLYGEYLLQEAQKQTVVKVDTLEAKFELILKHLQALTEALPVKQQQKIAKALAEPPVENAAETPAEPEAPAAGAEGEQAKED